MIYLFIIWLIGLIPAAIRLKQWQKEINKISDSPKISDWRVFLCVFTWPIGLLYLIYFWVIMMLAYKGS